MTTVVKVSDISKRYGKNTALDNISFSVGRGELFGIIGPDGAGKSSLYRILATLLLPEEGKVEIAGLDVVKDFRKLRPKIGYMPERFSLYQDLTVRENLNFFASLFDVSVKKNYDLIAPIFGQLEHFPDRKAGALSGGMKQKLALSCALIHRPEILLLDEPTTGVDAVSRNEFWNMLAGLKEHGITILVSTSYMDEATKCDQIAMMNEGQILDIDTPANLVSHIEENLFNASAHNMFKLLSELREMPQVEDCYTFGSTLHIVARSDFNPEEIGNSLKNIGMQNVRIYPAKGDIEDLFIKLTRNER
ncbi:MAG: ABC transporter ATP-binding protein [Muribaculaceae bacterium]|nr:ABC transporter ATP-binding protein [Muribaculaceae bacterium]